MIALLLAGEVSLFVTLLAAIILSLSLHEFGHAQMATWLGDDTPRRQGRLTINPIAHIDPIGLLMVIMIGFGYAKPVQFDGRHVRQKWGTAAVAAAGPAMNLLLAILAINFLAWCQLGNGPAISDNGFAALAILAQINLLLMLFNLLPLGPLDGHYIMSWLLPSKARWQYDTFNARYGTYLFLGLIVLSFLGIPVFRFLMDFSARLVPFITFI